MAAQEHYAWFILDYDGGNPVLVDQSGHFVTSSLQRGANPAGDVQIDWEDGSAIDGTVAIGTVTPIGNLAAGALSAALSIKTTSDPVSVQTKIEGTPWTYADRAVWVSIEKRRYL